MGIKMLRGFQVTCDFCGAAYTYSGGLEWDVATVEWWAREKDWGILLDDRMACRQCKAERSEMFEATEATRASRPTLVSILLHLKDTIDQARGRAQADEDF